MSIPLPVIANTYRVSFNWLESSTAQRAANILHFQRTAGTATDVYNDLAAHVATNMWYSTVSTARIASLDIIKLDGSSGRVTFSTSGAAWAGQATAGEFIPNQPYLVKFGTGLRGRNHRGRIYLPFLAESQAQNGALPAGAVTAMATAWSTFLAAMLAASCFLVVASYDRRHSGAGAAATTVTTIAPEAALGTMRKRQARLR